MTDNTQYLPVTQAAAVETKIQNSVKISKQLMKSELKKRIDDLTKEEREADTKLSVARDLVKMATRTLVEKHAMDYVARDGELTRIRNFFNKFSCIERDSAEKYFDKNTDMVRCVETGLAESCMLGTSNFKNMWPEYQKQFEEDGTLNLTVELRIRDYETTDYHENYLRFDLDFHATEELYKLSDAFKEAEEKWRELSNKLDSLKEKLNGIDQVAEQMEAQLLVQELSQSEEGRLALETAGQLVGDMLGETPTLLQLSGGINE
ncbi:hypothetical protein J8Z28_20385 [Pseudoalteromonas sp. SCSIO 43088]|uniref:hypothetical protein n=1 Tax=Pseudoalteromonas sp. SCSIO 43088 TaxID=2822846 RepID=UPI00202B3F41|nr:hypothetical protein [Pseudoalteromonas sp. SCSIO 43088]URQ88246.1 hypothetical protein J8Z28_20385 [Pseudoalteromonas sp. SCSIO 43088]